MVVTQRLICNQGRQGVEGGPTEPKGIKVPFPTNLGNLPFMDCNNIVIHGSGLIYNVGIMLDIGIIYCWDNNIVIITPTGDAFFYFECLNLSPIVSLCTASAYKKMVASGEAPGR